MTFNMPLDEAITLVEKWLNSSQSDKVWEAIQTLKVVEVSETY